MPAKRLLYLVNDPDFFLTHRGPIAKQANASGFNVHVATAPASEQTRSGISALGLQHHTIPISRGGLNPVRELVTFVAVLALLRKLKPDLLHAVTMKPLLYGCIAARLAAVPAVVAAVSGLGYLSDPTKWRPKTINLLLRPLYPLAFAHPNLRVIFQNESDQSALVQCGLEQAYSLLIRGSGVDLDSYAFEPEPDGTPVVTLAARLLHSKGVETFVQAASIAHARGVRAQFRVIGQPDPGNPDSVTDAELNRWTAGGLILALGQRTDMPRQLSLSHVVVLPSHYGEGLPKVLLEAAACGRPVITTDHPGCRDAIRPGVTGLLVPPRNPCAVAEAITRLVRDGEMRRRMGHAARLLAEKEFDVRKVVAAHIDLYRTLGDRYAAKEVARA